MTKIIKKHSNRNYSLSYNGIMLDSWQFFDEEDDNIEKTRVMFVVATPAIPRPPQVILKGALNLHEVEKRITEWILKNKKEFFDALFARYFKSTI